MDQITPDDPRPEPPELRVGRNGIGLAWNVPVAVRRGEISKRPRRLPEISLGVGSGAAMIDLVRPDMLLEILHGIEHGPGFQQRNVNPQIRQYLHHRPASGARTNHHYVVHLWTALDLEHFIPNITPGGRPRPN